MRAASRPRPLPTLVVPIFALAFAGCHCGSSTKPMDPAPSVSSSSPAVASSAVVERPRLPPPVRQGGALARSVTGDALYLADEDHGVVRVIPLPLPRTSTSIEVKVPGRPANVLPIDGRVLVTIRDPGLLLILRPDAAAGLVEVGRVALPADAWGMAITPDEKTVVVTSAWTHQVSAVDLEKASKRWSIDVAREPRGVAITSDGQRGYVSHLVGSALTRLDDLAGHGAAKAIALPPSPLRTPDNVTLGTSLGYTVVLSPDDRRLFAPRHALGAMGSMGVSDSAWFGASTVDVLLPSTDAPLCPKRNGPPNGRSSIGAIDEVPLLSTRANALIQPRAAVYRASTRTLLVVGEGNAALAEVDAMAIDPMAVPLHVTHLQTPYSSKDTCFAPTGVALSADESTAFMYCRAEGNILSLVLGSTESDRMNILRVAGSESDSALAEGRRLFYEGNDPLLSGGLACSGCHPEGRDDGFVWSEGPNPDGARIFTGGPHMFPSEHLPAPRQTPMLAGRVSAEGPYGWHGQNKDLAARVLEGAGLHRWRDTRTKNDLAWVEQKAVALATFLRKGLVPPPRDAHEPTAAEGRGKELFLSAAVGCASCHPAGEYTDRAPIVLRATPALPGYVDEVDRNFKTPSLLFVAGTPPYFHDGSAPTLEALIAGNDDRMGKTKQLSREDQAALVAFLKTL